MGPRASLVTLIAAALEPSAIGGITLHNSVTTLKEVIEHDLTFEKIPEFFCFGLLEEFDIPQLAELVAPRPVRFEGAPANLPQLH
jgi:hypothetical protein